MISVYGKEGFKNAKYIRYPDGTVKFSVCDWNVYKPDGYVQDDGGEVEYWFGKDEKKKAVIPQSVIDNMNLKHNQARAKRKVFDIAMLNDFKYFITLTLNEKMIDRYDSKIVMTRVKKWLNNMTNRHNLKYILIPEYHKDKAIHMHGLFSGDFKLKESGKLTKSGKTIYNLPQWRLGYSTCIECYGDTCSVSNYITKYITKGIEKIFGNYYYAGGGLVRDPETFVFDMEYNSINLFEHEVMSGLNFKFLDCDESTFGDYMNRLFVKDLEEMEGDFCFA